MKNFLLCSFILIGASTAHAGTVSARCSNAEHSMSIEMVGDRNMEADQTYFSAGATGTLARAGQPTVPITSGGMVLELGSGPDDIKVFGFAGRANPGNILVMVKDDETEPGFAGQRLVGFPLRVLIKDQNDEEFLLTCVANF